MAQSHDGGGGSPPPPFAPVRIESSDVASRPLPTATSRADTLTGLVYELLDAHGDTEQLAREDSPEFLWHAHLDYLRDLQRVAREVLAHVG